MDALVNLQKKHPFDPEQVKEDVVHVATSEGALVDNREMPDICLQYMVAVMLLDKTASPSPPRTTSCACRTRPWSASAPKSAW